MSKKMMKRSLALGALMAFVITGSAMAAGYDYQAGEAQLGQKPDSYKVLTNDSFKDNKDGLVSTYTTGGSHVNCRAYERYWDLQDNKVTIEADASGKNAGYSTSYVGVQASNFEFIGSEKSELIIKSGNYGLQVTNGAIGSEDAKIGSLEITAGNIGILHNAPKYADSTMKIYVKDLSVDAVGDAMQLTRKTTIDADKIDITKARRAIRVSANVVDIAAKEINISGATKESLVAGNGTLNFTASEKGLINNDFLSGEDGNSKGVLNMILGSGVEWTGKIATDSGSASVGALDLSGTWNLTEASSLTNATFNAGSTLVIEGADYENADGKNEAYALNGVGDKATLTVENGAKLNVTGIKETTYNVATGFAEIKGENYWTVGNMADLNNNLMEGKWLQDENKNLQLQIAAKEADTLVEELGVSETTGEFLNTLVKDAGEVEDSVTAGSAEAKLVGLANAAAQSKNPVVVAKAAEALQKMAEAGGNSATAANVVNNVTNVTGQRMSFTGGNNGNKGGHGVGLLEEGSGAAIWAQYVHGKDSVEDMPSEAGASSYEGQYNGIVMGVDFKKVNKFQSGIAFNYGEGDTHSVNTTSPTRSDYDFWGIGYYGNIRNADSNVIFDIGYAKTDSDVTSNILGTTFEASPETTTWTAGVKVEKLYQNNNVQIVPYTGLRYMSIDPEDYSTKCGAMGYKMERQDIWLLPLGVSIRQEVVNNNGWVVTPKVDLSYIWAFGDTDSSMETNTVFGSDNRPIGYDVMDDGSWMGLVGVEAAMDDWTFGVSYSYQKGDHSESKKWYVDAKYSF